MITRPSFLPLVVLNQRPAGSGLTLAVSLIGGLMIWACDGEETTGPDVRFQAAYVTNYLSDDVSVIATASNTVVATVAVGAGAPASVLPGGVAITPFP